MINNNEKITKYMQYLEEAGVNKNIIKYLEKKPYIISGKIIEIIGEDLYSMYKDKHIEELKKGTSTFKITKDGEIWWKDENTNPLQQSEKKIRINGINHTFMMRKQIGTGY